MIFLLRLNFVIQQLDQKKDLKRFMAVNRGKIAQNLASVFPQFKSEDFIKNSSDRMLRLVCFSESTVDRLDEILIWSHYANKHHSVRIGFEFPDGITSPFKIVPVQYRQERVAIDMTMGSETELVKKALSESIRVKSLAWEYEREYRMLTMVSFCKSRPIDGGGRADFVSFERQWVKQVDFDLRALPNDVQVMKEFLKKEYPHVQLRQAVFHPRDYALEYKII